MTECSFLYCIFAKSQFMRQVTNDPLEKQIVHYSIYCSLFYVVVVIDVLMFLDCVQISSCELCGV